MLQRHTSLLKHHQQESKSRTYLIAEYRRNQQVSRNLPACKVFPVLLDSLSNRRAEVHHRSTFTCSSYLGMKLTKVLQLVLLLSTTSLIVAATPGCHKHHTSLVSQGPTSTPSKRLRLLLIAPDSVMAQTKQASAMTTQSLRDSTAQASKVDAPVKEQRVFAGTGNRRLLETFPGGVAAPNNFLSQSKHASSLVTKDLRETESRAAEFSKATQDRFANKQFLP